MELTVYMHRDKDENLHLMRTNDDINEEDWPNIKYLLSEVEIKVYLDLDTGKYEILEVNGKELKGE